MYLKSTLSALRFLVRDEVIEVRETSLLILNPPRLSFVLVASSGFKHLNKKNRIPDFVGFEVRNETLLTNRVLYLS